jgi:hypothetical protein
MIVHHPEAKYYSIRGEGTAEPRGKKPAVADSQRAVASGTAGDSR